MRLHLAAQFGDHFLRRLGEQLSQRERGQSLNHSGGENGEYDWREQLDLPLANDVVH